MELWIRTQTKTGLFKVDSVYYAGIDKNKYIIYYKDIRLGIYKTKERALEILDEIQNIIKIKFALQCDNKIAFNGIPEKDINYLLHQCAVFDMPQE